MCLSTVTKNNLKSKIVMSGYKEFNVSGGNLCFQSYPLKSGKNIVKDTWIKAEGPSSIKATDNSYYPAFFHVYEEESKSRTRVFVRGLKTIGTQSGEKVLVAEELYIPSDPNSWPDKNAPAPKGTSAAAKLVEKMSSLIDEFKKTSGNA